MFFVQSKETVNKTFRFPVDLLAHLEVTANLKKISLSSLVFQACEYALNSMEKGGGAK